MSKVAIIGGGGIRTPLLVHAMAKSRTLRGIDEVALYDIDRDRVSLIAELVRFAATQAGSSFKVYAANSLEQAVDGASFVLSSVRVGGIKARAHDERFAIQHGRAGQETTGLAGMLMAMRTIPVVLEHARIIEKLTPKAWLINFTNPAGLITQALTTNTSLRVIGICDTPSELFHRIALGLGRRETDVTSEYFGLNHLGWVRRIVVDGNDVIDEIINDDSKLRSLYHADLFEPEMIRDLSLIPSEYLYFYYHPDRALKNQIAAGASRGEEIERMNERLFQEIGKSISEGNAEQALRSYRHYLNLRSGSYMRLEAEAGSAFTGEVIDDDPFESSTGYHRIAIEVMEALESEDARRIVIDVLNGGSINDLEDGDVVEIPCLVNRDGPKPSTVGSMPETVRDLVFSVKEYERLTIRAAVERSISLAQSAMKANPLINDLESGDLSPLFFRSEPLE